MTVRVVGLVFWSTFAPWAVWLTGCASSVPLNAPRSATAGRTVETRSSALDRARAGWGRLASGDTTALSSYNEAVNHFLDHLEPLDPQLWSRLRSVDTPRGRVAIRLDPGTARGVWNARSFERLEGIDKAAPNPVVPVAVRAGIGVPLVARVRPVVRRGKTDPSYPPDGQFAPATAVLNFNRAGNVATLRLLDPRECPKIEVGGRPLVLAADFATAEHRRLGGNFHRVAFGGLFHPGNYVKQQGLYFAGPYRPGKIPVIFTHGLISDPHIWQNVAAAVDADPVLGRRYQIWYYIYPTGHGVPTSALAFRQVLSAARAFHDPRLCHPGSRRGVAVGHSMGGILSHMMVVDSGEDFRRAYVTAPLDSLPLTPEERQRARELWYWRRDPGISRAVFIATPHRGAALAAGPVGNFAGWLVRLPATASQAAADSLHLDAHFLTPEMRRRNRITFTSIETLRPSHPYFKALAARPIKVPFHSIIGDRGRGDTPASSDGVVPYASSHLAGAKSECIVPDHHGCAEHAASVKEVVRILHEHLGRSRRAGE